MKSWWNLNWIPQSLIIDDYFAPKTSVICERTKVNSRVKNMGEPVADFINALHNLGEKCDLKDELIRDKIVVGILDKKTSQKDAHGCKYLKLEKAIKTIGWDEKNKLSLGSSVMHWLLDLGFNMEELWVSPVWVLQEHLVLHYLKFNKSYIHNYHYNSW